LIWTQLIIPDNKTSPSLGQSFGGGLLVFLFFCNGESYYFSKFRVDFLFEGLQMDNERVFIALLSFSFRIDLFIVISKQS